MLTPGSDYADLDTPCGRPARTCAAGQRDHRGRLPRSARPCWRPRWTRPGRTRRPTPRRPAAPARRCPDSSPTTSRTRRAATGRRHDITGRGRLYPQNPNAPVFDARYATSGTTNFWGYNVPGNDPTTSIARPTRSPSPTVGSCASTTPTASRTIRPFTYDGGIRRVLDQRRRELDRRRAAVRLGRLQRHDSTLDTNPLAGAQPGRREQRHTARAE